ncbi:NADAR family protein [Flavobacterium psychrophilum]|uniref:NADAR family protein n=1 Tax=Flavobacterium psychrophilum TaxID=96345 RepID=UPI003B42B853
MIKEFQGDFRWLSNFSPVKIELDGLEFSSVEHAYMSAKSDDEKWKSFCSNSNNTAGNIKRESRNVKLKDNWNDIKLEIMQKCIEQKFNKSPFKALLLKTGNEHIQEGNRWNDKFWGVCLKTNEGENNLGKLIMSVRTALNEA